MKSAVRGLYAITPALPTPELLPAVAAAIAGGAALVQYRSKETAAALRHDQAAALLALCHDHGVPLIINDDAELAAALGADGVHLGAEDGAVADARRLLGSKALIGASCYNDLQRARAAAAAGADYLAFGSFYSSSSKPGARRASPQLLQQARIALKIPVVAIGGITPANAGVLLEAGADLLAVVHGVFGAEDVRQAAADYARLFGGTPAAETIS